MSRDAGQLRSWHAVAGFVALLGLAVGVVVLCRWLLVPVDVEAALPAPAIEDAVLEADGAECPSLPHDDLVRVTSSLLFACPERFDGREVVFAGEVVGLVLDRGERTWVQLNDDPYGLSFGPLPAHRSGLGGNSGIAALIPEALADEIRNVGGYGAAGDVLQVVATYDVAADADDGAPVLIVADGEVVREGIALDHDVSPRRVWAAVGAAVLAALTAGWAWLVRRGE